jgi:hypothetical protein
VLAYKGLTFMGAALWRKQEPKRRAAMVPKGQGVDRQSCIDKRIVEECIRTPFEADLCRWACDVTKRDYGMFLRELSAMVLGRNRSASRARAGA